MKIVIGYPKNWDKINEKFKFKDEKFLLTLGDTLYNPSNIEIGKSYMVHEEFHSKRQLRMGLEKYIQKYLNDPLFRFVEELLAYRIQWNFIKFHDGPSIDQLAKEFSSFTYGFDIDFETAKELIS